MNGKPTAVGYSSMSGWQHSDRYWANLSYRHCRRLLILLLYSAGFVALMLHLGKILLEVHVAKRAERIEARCANRSLGFEKIAVVSTRPSWRTDGLIAAAERTGIDLEILQQPEWTDAEVDVFRRGGVRGRDIEAQGRGPARCWLGHLNVLHKILARKWSTVLVMEDDADWDVAIKKQLALVAPMIRLVANAPDRVSDSPYGDAWDLLWLGHCGEGTPPSGPVLSELDDTLPESPIYIQDNRAREVFLPPQLRHVHRTYRATCTYAYAVTYAGAAKISQRAVGGLTDVISLVLHRWCRDGVLRCVSVNPELFHHHKQAGQLGSEVAALEGREGAAEPAKSDYTANIKYSARCNSKSKVLVTCQGNGGH